MSAALIELVSVGAQDVYITGDPQVSFFRQNYKRYTNFAMKPERMDYIGTFGASNEVVIPIRSKGDLMSYIWIEGTNISNVTTNSDGLFSAGAANPTTFEFGLGVKRCLNSILSSFKVCTTHFCVITRPRRRVP